MTDKWEYARLELRWNRKQPLLDIKGLNEMGRDGWELVSIVRYDQTSLFAWIFGIFMVNQPAFAYLKRLKKNDKH